MATLNQVDVTLSGMTSPVANDALATLTAQAVTSLSGVAANVTRVEFELLKASLVTAEGQDAQKEVVARSTDTSNAATGTYSVTFAAALFQDPGLYQVQAKGIVASGAVITEMAVGLSSELKVTEAAPQTLDDAKTAIAALEVDMAAAQADIEDHEDRIVALEGP
jgi:hypothetical protein